MRPYATRIAVLTLSLSFAGCASMPDVKVGYYRAKASLSITVTQTATCSASNVPTLVQSVDFQPSYSSDTTREMIDLSKLGSFWSKTNAAFEFFPDGRLKSINATQTGQAGDVLRAAVKLASLASMRDTTKATATACDRLNGIVGAGKALTIVHVGRTDFEGTCTDTSTDEQSCSIEFDQMSVRRSDYEAMRPIFGTIAGKYSIAKQDRLHINGLDDNRAQEIQLVEPALATVTVTMSREEDRAEWVESVLVPQHGTLYSLPIQKAPAFGENEFELVLHDSGKVTKLRYAGKGDPAGILGVVGDAVAASGGETVAAEAERIKAQADLIYQQQRLVLCQTDPTNCPK